MTRWGPAKLVHLVRELVQVRDGIALSIVVGAALCGVVAVALPFSPTIERFLVERHQLAGGPVAHLAGLAYPSMYSFVHHRYVSVHGFPPEQPDWPHKTDADVCEQGVWMAENHFPGRWMAMLARVGERCDAPQVFVELRTTGFFGEYRKRGVITMGDPPVWEVVP